MISDFRQSQQVFGVSCPCLVLSSLLLRCSFKQAARFLRLPGTANILPLSATDLAVAPGCSSGSTRNKHDEAKASRSPSCRTALTEMQNYGSDHTPRPTLKLLLFFTLPGCYNTVLQPWGQGSTWIPCGEKSGDHDLPQAQSSSCLLAAVPKHPCTIPSLTIVSSSSSSECHLQDLNKTNTNGWKLPGSQNHGAVDVSPWCQRDWTHIYSKKLFQCFS